MAAAVAAGFLRTPSRRDAVAVSFHEKSSRCGAVAASFMKSRRGGGAAAVAVFSRILQKCINLIKFQCLQVKHPEIESISWTSTNISGPI